MNFGTCPKCERKINDVATEHIAMGKAPQPQFRGISMLCPYCKVILGVSIDPIAMINETVELIAERFQAQTPAAEENAEVAV